MLKRSDQAKAPPRKLADVPEWAAENGKTQALKANFAAMRRELAQLQDEDVRQQAAEAARQLLMARKERTRADVEAAAERLLAGEAVGVAEAIAPDPRPARLARIAELETQIPVLAAAVVLQEGRLHKATGEASRVICAGLKDEHRALVLEIARHLVPLGRALDALIDFRQELFEGGVELDRGGFAYCMPTVSLGAHHYLKDEHGAVYYWLMGQVAAGALDPRDPLLAGIEKEAREAERKHEAWLNRGRKD